MNPEDMESMFEKLRHAMGGHKHKIIKTINPTEEEALEWMALKGFQENARKAAGVHNSKRQLFWSKIELRTGEVTRALQFNEKKNTIEVIDCDDQQEAQDWES